jgi:hypothetical protein
MSEQRAEQLIVVSLFVLLGSEIGNYLVTKTETTGHLSKQGKEGIGRRIVGGFLTMFFASLVAIAAPEVGALLAIAVASYAFLHDGLPAINRPYKQAERLKGAEGPFPGTTPGPTPGFEPLQEASPIVLSTLAETVV